MPLVVNILDERGNKSGTMDVSEGILGVEPNPAVVRQALDCYNANQRQGTHATKNRALVTGSQAKPYKQKGTGRARAGTVKSPIWRGGGVVFGPQPHKYTQRLNKKMRASAILGVLSDFHREDALFVVEDIKLEKPNTQAFASYLKELGAKGRVLILLDAGQKDEQGEYAPEVLNVFLSARNIPYATALQVGNINVYDLLIHDTLIATKGALKRLEEVYV